MVKNSENCGKNGVEIGFNNPGIEAHQDFTIFHHISPIKRRSTNWRESGFNMIQPVDTRAWLVQKLEIPGITSGCRLVGHPGISIFSIVLAVWSTKEDPDVLDDFSKKKCIVDKDGT